MKFVARFLTLVALLLLSVATVKADSGQTVSYTLTGPTDATFTISMGTSTSPTPEVSGQNYFFMVQPTDLVVDGTSMSDTIVFFNSSDLGGLNSVFDALPDLGGPQLYSGNESDPTLLTGVFFSLRLGDGSVIHPDCERGSGSRTNYSIDVDGRPVCSRYGVEAAFGESTWR